MCPTVNQVTAVDWSLHNPTPAAYGAQYHSRKVLLLPRRAGEVPSEGGLNSTRLPWQLLRAVQYNTSTPAWTLQPGGVCSVLACSQLRHRSI
jgi:hypothetical protein